MSERARYTQTDRDRQRQTDRPGYTPSPLHTPSLKTPNWQTDKKEGLIKEEIKERTAKGRWMERELVFDVFASAMETKSCDCK